MEDIEMDAEINEEKPLNIQDLERTRAEGRDTQAFKSSNQY